ncbi:MAG: CsbD family protein [bacterium]
MSRDEFEGKWHQLRGSVKSKWGQLTDNELDEVSGNFELLVGKIQEKYGQTREEIERQLDMLVTGKTV